MKKIAVMIVGCLLLTTPLHAISDTVTTSTSVTIQNIFAIEFYDGGTTNTSIRYPTGQIAFPAYDPASELTMILTSAWVNADGKSDVGVIATTNIGQNWALKVRMASATAQPTNVAIYKPDVVYIRNTDPATEATTGLTEQWYIMSNTDETIFSGSGGYQNTAPFGVLATFSFAILPTGQTTPSGQATIGSGNSLAAGTHNIDIIYTLTTTL